MRSMKFWGINILESLGIAVGAGAALTLFMIFSSSGGWQVILTQIMVVYPYYLMLAGAFVIMMYALGVFQTYFSLLVSMNVPRKTVVCGTIVSTGILAVGILAVLWIFWMLTPGEISQQSMGLLPLFAGILFSVIGVSMIIGVVILKWGKIGIVIMSLICAVMGGCLGMSLVLGAEDDTVTKLMKLAEMDFRLFIVIGLAVYAAAGVFAMMAAREIEVRR